MVLFVVGAEVFGDGAVPCADDCSETWEAEGETDIFAAVLATDCTGRYSYTPVVGQSNRLPSVARTVHGNCLSAET